ncbi:DUF6412 domain-containing protein [Actinoplanes sp. NPDC051859]|uniref:DUF6412 domain-containing protein n=1 Tax=Actinoplanes sp. NPDC051859 TaxID=3363909 RepID=UPI0037ABC40D
MIWFEALWRLVGALTDAGPTGLLLGTGAIAGLLLIVAVSAVVALSRRPAQAGVQNLRRALREWAGRAGVPRHRDPDAAGRTRPRGPTGLLAAA